MKEKLKIFEKPKNTTEEKPKFIPKKKYKCFLRTNGKRQNRKRQNRKR